MLSISRIDFDVGARLFGEAAGLAFVNGAGQWDIWQPFLWGERGGRWGITCLELKILGQSHIWKCTRSSSTNGSNGIRVRATLMGQTLKNRKTWTAFSLQWLLLLCLSSRCSCSHSSQSDLIWNESHFEGLIQYQRHSLHPRARRKQRGNTIFMREISEYQIESLNPPPTTHTHTHTTFMCKNTHLKKQMRLEAENVHPLRSSRETMFDTLNCVWHVQLVKSKKTRKRAHSPSECATKLPLL